MIKSNPISTNIINQDTLRSVQLETLKTLADALSKSFGPYGSNSIIFKNDSLPRYTKDGHTILSNIQLGGPIEKSVLADIEEETRNQAIKIGDSTTSIVILSYIIFRKLVEYQQNTKNDITPAKLVRIFKEVTNMIKEDIKDNGRVATIEDMYKIALISTNNNVELSKQLETVYKEYGLDVYIDVKASMNGTTYLKEINGMNLECGFMDPTFVNDASKNSCVINNPKIYAFKDPIDTLEMGMFLDTILAKNIIEPINSKDPSKLVPTVIMAPKISRDYSAYIDSIMTILANAPTASKGFLNIITDITGADMEQFEDICDLCGCKYIKKYLDPEIHKNEIESGLAPTPETVIEFAGSAETVSSDAYKTTFVNPERMYIAVNNNIEPSPLFKQRIDYLEKQIKKLEVEGNNTTDIYSLRKRLHSLQGKMVEIYIGGVTVADRDAERDLMEDAALNCRSAALKGVGYAANFEGLRSSYHVINTLEENTIVFDISEIICSSYAEISTLLYKSTGNSIDKVNDIVTDSIDVYNMPYNIITNEYDGNVLSSIETDICILDTISKIITIMATSNQFLLPTLNANMY